MLFAELGDAVKMCSFEFTLHQKPVKNIVDHWSRQGRRVNSRVKRNRKYLLELNRVTPIDDDISSTLSPDLLSLKNAGTT